MFFIVIGIGHFFKHFAHVAIGDMVLRVWVVPKQGASEFKRNYMAESTEGGSK